jgi:hypothetical protein
VYVCVCTIVILKFLDLLVLFSCTRFIKLFIWYQSEVISFKGMPLLLGFSSFCEEQGYLGSVINLCLSGSFA